MRKNYSPYLSNGTKELISARNMWKEVATKQGYKCAEKIAKELGRDIKKAIVEDRKAYFNRDFVECCD